MRYLKYVGLFLLIGPWALTVILRFIVLFPLVIGATIAGDDDVADHLFDIVLWPAK